MAKMRGRERLRRQLEAMPKAARDTISAAMEKSAEEIVRLARSLVPVEQGDLKASIGWTWGAAPRGAITLGAVRRPVERVGDLKITVYAGDEKAFYARFVEFGTAPHSVAKGGGTKAGQRAARAGGGKPHPGARAKPFFYPAYRAVKKTVKGRISRAANAAAKAAVAAGGGSEGAP